MAIEKEIWQAPCSQQFREPGWQGPALGAMPGPAPGAVQGPELGAMPGAVPGPVLGASPRGHAGASARGRAGTSFVCQRCFQLCPPWEISSDQLPIISSCRALCSGLGIGVWTLHVPIQGWAP